MRKALNGKNLEDGVKGKVSEKERVSTSPKKGEGTKAPRGRPSPERSAQITGEIVQLAAELFLDVGYERTTMETVAQRAGIPKTTLYKRFPDKAELLRAVIETRLNEWSQANTLRDHGVAQELEPQLSHQVASLLVWTTKPEVRAISRLASYLPGSSAEGLMAPGIGGYENMRSHITKVIVEFGPAAGTHAEDPQDIAEMIMALVGGLVVNRRDPSPVEQQEALLTARKLVRRLIAGSSAW